MSSERQRRRDERWNARYARSQRRIEQHQAQPGQELPIPYVPSLSSVVAKDGSTYMIRLIPPGEPVESEGRFAASVWLTAMLGGGRLPVPVADNRSWVVVVERQRGPWRGFDRVGEHHHSSYADAAQQLQRIRDELERR